MIWYRRAAEQGVADAQYNLGFMYRNGQGVPQDDKQAVDWYRKAAEQGDTVAQLNLGLMYYYGKGVPQDYKEAYAWACVATEKKDPLNAPLRNEVAKLLSPSALSEAQALASANSTSKCNSRLKIRLLSEVRQKPPVAV